MSENNVQSLKDWLEFSGECTNGNVSSLLNVIDDKHFGRGIQANDNIPKGTVIIKVPKPFLLNYLTTLKFFSYWNVEVDRFLSKHIYNFDKTAFKTSEDEITKIYTKLSFEKLIKLTSHQLLSMFLLLEKKRKSNSWWKPFLDCLPNYKDYEGTPMTWKFDENVEDEKLLSSLPKFTRLHVEKQIEQFNSDFAIVTSLLLPFQNIFSKKEYLWAWITVNTRCMYFELPKYLQENGSKNSSVNKITLVPYADYINHHFELRNAEARCTKSGYDVVTIANVKKGEYIWFSYGPHNDSFLQCEYGFSMSNTNSMNNEKLFINKYNSIDITEIIVKLLNIPKKESVLKWLTQSGYLGDYTIGFETVDRTKDMGPHIISKPSHRTRIALAALIEKEDDFKFNQEQYSFMCPVKLEKFLQGFNDGEYYLKTETALLQKILTRYKKDLTSKLETLNSCESNFKSNIVRKLLSSEIYLIEHV